MNKVIVISGMPGAGKSTVSKIIAQDFGFTLYDVDDHLPQWMKDKMKNATPLTDDDREIYLKDAIIAVNKLRLQKPVIFTSPLYTNKHRKMIYEAFDKPLFIWLEVPFQTLEERVTARSQDHFVNPHILTKLYNHNEPLTLPHITIDARQPIKVVVESIKKNITKSITPKENKEHTLQRK
ncbi:AAA family ATPase [Candidatus Woesearchaeota archaeon]|nr:AAA family ATPase [Candidatus Woesearchaeota archaeon]